MGKEIIVTNENFEKEVLQSEKLVIVDFWAEWCGPCKMVTPIIEEISIEYETKLKVCKCDIDKYLKIAENYKVFSIPTFIVYKNGKEMARSIGAASKQNLVKLFIDKV
jgi:thioredoxin 1